MGTGFDPVPRNNTVILAPVSGAPVSTSGLSLGTADPATGLRRLEFKMPDGLTAGPVTVQVRIGKSGPTAAGVTMQVINVVIPQPVSAARGSTVSVRFLGSPNTTFAEGGTAITSDGRVSVMAMQFVSPTEIVATVAVRDNAALGPRVFMLTSPRQGAFVATGFQVVNAAPPNRPPIGAIGGPYSGALGSAVAFSSSGSSDPDGDALQYRWNFGDGGSSIEANPQHTFAAAGVFAVTLSLADGRGGTASAASTATIAAPIVLTALQVSPPEIRFAELGQTAPLAVSGQYSDGSSRDLTHDSGTTFSIEPSSVALVSSAGVVTAIAAGNAIVTTRHGGLSATTPVEIVIASSSGFLRGETFDDTRGVPLAGANATLLIAGGVDLVPPQVAAADERGRFALPTVVGPALVRIERSGFTAVERQASPASGAVVTLLDTRLTPLDGRVNLLQSVFGGEARSSDGSTSVSIPPGGLDQDTAIRVTPLSNQGLQGLLPAGWSPIAGVDLQPAERAFSQPGTLRLPHADTLAIGAAVTVARYDAGAHQWVAHATGHVSDDRRTITAPISSTGQYAIVIPDDQPSAPPAVAPGQALAGVNAAIVAESATVTGSVLPRSAPPGDGARAVGTIVLEPPSPMSSGVVLRARVTEQFDLLDSSRVVPLPFVQDVVLFARPRVEGAGTLAARIPITPSLQFTIQQLSLGTVRLDVTTGEPLANNLIVGTGGGTISDENGNSLEVPAGSLSSDVAVGLQPLTADRLSAGVPSGFTLLGAVLVEMVGASFNQPAGLSIPRPAGLDQSAQIIAAEVITDFAGGRRLRIVGVGEISTSRVAVQTTLASHTFEGVRKGGEFLFLQPAQPLGFVTGRVVGAGAAPQALSLVTASTAPFAFMTGNDGTFVVGGRPTVATNLAAIESAGATASGSTVLAAPNTFAVVNLALSQIAPTVTVTDPVANATNVALDAPLVIDFSKSIDPTTITAASVVLRSGTNIVSTIASLSANRRRLTVTRGAPLQGLTTHTLTLTAAIRDLAGVELAALAPLAFTTIDPSKPAVLALGLVTADLPDEDGLSLVTGGPGATEPNSVVVVTNGRTLETVTVLSAADGSFRLRVNVLVGDSITLTFRDSAGRVTTVAITQFTAIDGRTAIGSTGGSVLDGSGRIGRILPRALAASGVFAIEAPEEQPLPVLPAAFAILDRFALRTGDAAFKQVESLTLSESQDRFNPTVAFAPPFASTALLTVPADFLVTASMRFTAIAIDRDGARRSSSGTTAVVASAPDTAVAEHGASDEFPTVYLSAPREAVQTQTVTVSAVAPAARVEFDLPLAAAPAAGDALLLTRAVSLAGAAKLSFVDTLRVADVAGQLRIRTNGRELPGASQGGDYIAFSGPVAFARGIANGAAAVVTIDGWPFIFETSQANGAFTLPVPADAAFVLRFVDAVDGTAIGTTNGQPTAAGATIDIGRVLAGAGGTLVGSAQPDARASADISTPLTIVFSETLDRSTVTNGAIVVTDTAGVRVFGRVALSADDRTVTFVPTRRWRFATRYRYGVATTVVAASGTRMAAPLSGEFTTFAPRLIAAMNGNVTDVSTSGSLALIATPAGASVVGIAQPSAPAIVSNITATGGAGGVVLATEPLLDRFGAAVSGPVAIVAEGDASVAAVVRSYTLATPAAPVLLGATQITTAPGQPAPAGVPAVSGAPNAVVVVNGRALVSVRDAGVQSVTLGAAIPHDPAQPGLGNSGRFPATGASDAAQSAAVGDRIVVAGRTALSVLGPSLLSITTIGSPTPLTSVAAIANAAIDLDGNGVLDPDRERFDLAVAGDQSGLVHFYRLPLDGEPELLSVVRLPGGQPIGGVSLDASERLAYIGAGANGLMLIDLDGPSSIQPLDADHDVIDDRILGSIDTRGVARRIALDLDRGVGFIADGPGGLAVAQLTPARVRFDTLMRDPVLGQTGDEQSILHTRAAFTSDAALRVGVTAAIPAGLALSLSIDETPSANGARLLSFQDGTRTTPLTSGANAIAILIDQAALAAATNATLRVHGLDGTPVATLSFGVGLADVSGGAIRTLILSPADLVMDNDEDTGQLAVMARLFDGRTLNLTRAATGTTYVVANPKIAAITPDGLLVPLAGGITEIFAMRSGLVAAARLRVFRAPALERFELPQPRLTLTSPRQAVPSGAIARFTDGSTARQLQALGVTFESSDPLVASVDGAGRIAAVADGTATIGLRLGQVAAQIAVAVEFRVSPTLAAVALAPWPAPVRTDLGSAEARATVTGAGSLEGLSVEFSIDGGPVVARALTGYQGTAVARLPALSPRTATVRAAVINPADGNALSDTETVTIVAGGADAEPNGDLASATPIAPERTIAGTLGGSDIRDVFKSEQRIDGTLTASVTLTDTTDPATVRLLFFSASGQEIGRTTPTSRLARVAQPIAGGAGFVAIETTGGAVSYTLSIRYAQGPLSVASVSPLSGGPGTTVTIAGTGFSVSTEDVRVLFGGVGARVMAASARSIEVRVPANAVDGPITVVVMSRRALGPQFATGNAGPRAPNTLVQGTPEIRFDPVLRQDVDVTRLTVFMNPEATRLQVAELAGSLNGSIAGHIPSTNSYVIEFAAIRTLTALEATARQLSINPLVRRVLRVTAQTLEQTSIDARDRSGSFPGTSISRGAAYAQARVFDAIESVRETPPFVSFDALFQPVKIAVIDTGFAPFTHVDFQSSGQNLVSLYRTNDLGVFTQVPINISSDPSGHGTQVTSIIAGINDGDSGLSGSFGSLFRPGEAAFQVHVYSALDRDNNFWNTAIFNALAEIADQGDVDVLNLSFGQDWPGPSAELDAAIASYADAFLTMGGRTLIVTSAGNGGVQAEFHTPSILESTLPFVMSIGAVAVANIDGSGEGADARAVFSGSAQSQASLACSATAGAGGSNCGFGVTMTAPGEDVLVATRGAPGFTNGAGTSFASPMIAGIAALLRAIGPAASGFSADLIRTLLVDSADDITPTWGTGQTIRRVNALNAVRLLLPASAPQMIYVADQSAGNGAAPPGRIIGIDIDPLNGLRPTPPNPDIVIPLSVTKRLPDGSTATLAVGNPTSVLASPAGDKLYAVVQGGAGIGDGVLVVNTRSNLAIDFVPFSGNGFPAAEPALPPVHAPSLRPGMTFSKDGRLLYVAAGGGLAIINTTEDRLVRAYHDLPSDYSVLADEAPTDGIETALATIAASVGAGTANRAGTGITGLALSPDGKVLYAAVQTGGGGGQQPGGLLAIDVNLYGDAKPVEVGLQSNLASYLVLLTADVVPMAGAGSFLGGDEPSAVAVSRGGNHVYLVNGGLNFFEAIPPADLDLQRYNFLLLGPAMTVLGLPGGIAGVITATSAFLTTAERLYNELLQDIRQQASSGVTFLSAPGVTAVYDGVSDTPPGQQWLFTSDIGFGWNPSAANGGAIVNQFRFRDVFAKRPFAMAMRPDGRRAILPYFHTGNFGVVDLDAQATFEAPVGSTPKPAFATLPDTEFQGVVGVTPALRFDNHLWPSRGAFRSNTLPVPSPDERRLFTWHAEYAQNGRFAVATHVGTGAPRTVSATIPDFVTDASHRFDLEGLGGTVDGTTMTIIEDGEALTVGVGDTVELSRGGGSITVIDDRAITSDFDEHLDDSIAAANGTTRPHFATAPICRTIAAGGATRCDTDVTTSLTEYVAAGATTQFHRPRGASIQPFLVADSPRFGDHVQRSTALQMVWRDARIRQMFVTIRDLVTIGPDTQPLIINQVGGQLTQSQIDTMTSAIRVGDLFPPDAPPVQGRRYQLRVSALIQTPAIEELSAIELEVVFDDPQGEQEELELRPVLVPFLTVPTSAPKQLTVRINRNDGSAPDDVTSSLLTTYLWLGDPAGQIIRTSNASVNLAMQLADVDVSAIINAIKAKLSEAGVPVNFQLADITVTSGGQLTVGTAGLQVVQAVHNRDGRFLFSAPTLVLGGLELSKIDLEPSSLLNNVAAVTGIETLGKKLADRLGRKVNTPLILTATDPGTFSFIDNTGEVELEDVEFSFLGTGSISIDNLLKAIEPLVRKRIRQSLGGPLSPAARLAGFLGAKAIMAMIDETIEEASIRFVDLASAHPAVATVNNEVLYKGDVTATGPGLTAITGELSLGDFGSAKDTVPVFVLPNLTEAILDPINSLICRTDNGPGPTISTLASIRIADTITLTPADVGLEGDSLELAELLLPEFLPTGVFHDVVFTLGTYKFGFRGSITINNDGITWTDPEVRFYVPNVPGVTNTYNIFPPGNPQLPGIVHTGTVKPFAVHLLHDGVAGRNQITNFVSIPGLGSAQGIGSVTVTNLCSTPFVVKESTDSITTAAPGDSLSYVVTVSNPGSQPLENVVVEDIASYVASASTGDPEADIIEVTQVQTIPVLPPHAQIEVRFLIPAFGGSFGTISNRAKATGSVPITNVTRCQVDPTLPGCSTPPACANPPCGVPPPPQVEDPCTLNPQAPGCRCKLQPTAAECLTRPPDVIIGMPFITEMVLAPQRDWSDSSGGVGAPFDAVPGTGAVDGDDVWIEVASLTALSTWTLRLTDAAGATHTAIVGPPILGAQVKVVSGFGVGSSPIIRVELVDDNGLARTTLDIANMETVLGPASSAADESLAWSVLGSPTGLLQQFVRRPATISVFSPF